MGGFYTSAELQSVYSTASAEWAGKQISFGLFKNQQTICLQIIYIYIYIYNLELNYLPELIYHKTQRI